MTVSVIIPIYNNTLQELVDTLYSLAISEDQNYEAVLVFDGMGGNFKEYKDSISSILQAYYFDMGAKYQFRVVDCSHNSGPSVARNVGVAYSCGDIITYLDCGDTMAPHKIGNLKQGFQENDAQLLFMDFSTLQGEDVIEQYVDDKVRKCTSLEGLLGNIGFIPPLAVAHTRKLFYQVGGFQPGLKSHEENVMWRRLAKQLDFGGGIWSTKTSAGLKVHQEENYRNFWGVDFDLKTMGATGQKLDEGWFENFTSPSEWFEATS